MYINIQKQYSGLCLGAQKEPQSPASVPYCFSFSFQNKCVPYWPEVGTQRVYGLYSVTNSREHDTAEYKLRTLQISPLDNVSVPKPRTLMYFLVWGVGAGRTRILCGSSRHYLFVLGLGGPGSGDMALPVPELA